MKISLKNIAKLKRADIEIDGIAVIAGPNNTGKSAVSKALFSVFNSFYQILNKINEEKSFKIMDLYYDMVNKYEAYGDEDEHVEVGELSFEIVEAWEKSNKNRPIFCDIIYKMLCDAEKRITTHIGKEKSKPYIEQMFDILEIPSDLIASRILSKKIFSVFDKQVNNVNTEDCAEILLKIKNKIIEVSIYSWNKIHIKNMFNLDTDSLYLDDPFIIDLYTPEKIKIIRYNHEDDHKKHLYYKLFSQLNNSNIIDELLHEKKLQDVYGVIDNINIGEMTQYREGHFYKEKNSKEKLRLKNLSSGLKAFVIVKKLIQNNAIKDKGTLILDEPEIHLHPEWQLVFAELIVLLQKTFNLHILLTTHSPYFLRAIQVYAAKHEIADKCTYYLSRLEGDDTYIDDVSNDIEKIYSSLARPFQTLENEKWRLYE